MFSSPIVKTAQDKQRGLSDFPQCYDGGLCKKKKKTFKGNKKAKLTIVGQKAKWRRLGEREKGVGRDYRREAPAKKLFVGWSFGIPFSGPWARLF
jgi:hypothetical protein